ncbi:MAG: MBL fold metallo-hydrolase [Solobacterium sp.]|nr:MBL fold metallo-hydrolase [Solobacterium sp.]
MKLFQATPHVWYSEFDDDYDLPALGLVVGDTFSIAIDAGHSKQHVLDFYASLKEHHLPLPSYTFITHWHWDHSFGMHAIHGKSVAESITNQHLLSIAKDQNYLDHLFETNKKFATVFAKEPLQIVPADIVFEDTYTLDLGGLHIHAFHTPSPHTEDCTCVLVEEEKVLFVGDCICGTYPTWEIDPIKNKQLIDTLKPIDFTYAIGGHWHPFTKDQLLDDLIHFRLT